METSPTIAHGVFEAIIQVSPLAIAVLDCDGKVVAWNPAAQRIFGWSPAEVLGQEPPFILEDKQAKFSALRAEEMKGEIRGEFELRRQRKDGTLIDVRLWTAPICDVAGRIMAVLNICEDITERKRGEEVLLRRSSQLEAVGHVSAEIARELDLARVLRLIHHRAMSLIGADGGSLYLWDEATQRLVPQVWHGIPDGVGALALKLGEGVCGVVAEHGVGLMVNDYHAFHSAHPRFLAETTIRAVLAEPLRVHDKLVGVIAVNHQEDARSFSNEDQQLLRLFSAQAAIAIENARLYQDVERQRWESELVADLSQKLNASLDLDTVLQRVTEGAKKLTGSDLAQIALRDGQSDTLVFRYRAGSYSGRLDTHRIEPRKGIGGKVLVSGQPFRTANYAADPRITKDYLEETLAEGVVAELAVPIKMENRVEGVLFVDNRSPRPFTDEDERTLQRLADHAAIAIRNARLHATAVRRAQQLASLNTVTRALTTELDPHLVTRQILEATQVLFPGVAAMLLEHPEGSETLRVAASLGLRDSGIARSFRLRAGEGLAGIATETREPVVSTGVAWDPRFVNRSWAASEGLVSGIVLPLVYGDRVTGVLSAFLRRPHTFVEDEIDLLRAFAAQCATALENARLFEQVYVGRAQLLNLTQRTVAVQEEERRRLSRELHDETGQALTALRISLGLIREDLPEEADGLRRRLSEAVTLAESITDQVRGLAQALRPPALETLGLHAALEGFCREFSRRTRLIVDYRGQDLPGLRDSVGIHLYRLVQEALTNVSKHAQAHRVRVVLGGEGDVVSLLVQDDGAGFDATAKQQATSPEGIGLIGMRERVEQLGGRLEIKSQPGYGTCLVARVPWTGIP